jgi:hypothetical protein
LNCPGRSAFLFNNRDNLGGKGPLFSVRSTWTVSLRGWRPFAFGGEMARTPKTPIPDRIRTKVFERDGYQCRYCGSKSGPFHADHVYPESKGGETSISNLVTACKRCNVKKSAKVGLWPKPIGYFRQQEELIEASRRKANHNHAKAVGVASVLSRIGSITLVISVLSVACFSYLAFSGGDLYNIRLSAAVFVGSVVVSGSFSLSHWLICRGINGMDKL